jgi:hypothetical protein
MKLQRNSLVKLNARVAGSASNIRFAQGVEAGTWKFSTSINDKIRTVPRKSWQDAAKAVERLIEQALSPKSAACTSSFEVRSGFIPAKSGKGGGLRLREDQDAVDNQPPSVDESK